MAMTASKGAVDDVEVDAEEFVGAGTAEAAVVRSVRDGILERRSPAEAVDVVEDWIWDAA